MVGVIKLGRRKASVPATVVPVSSAGPYAPVSGYVPPAVPNYSGGATGAGTGNVVTTSQNSNPRSAANVPLGLGESALWDGGTRSITLGTAPYTDQAMNLGMLADIIELNFTITSTVTAGTVSYDFINCIDHVQLATAQGMIKAIIPGSFLKANYIRFSALRQALPTTTSTSSGATFTIVVPGLRLPRAYGPWQLTVFYSTIATAAAGCTAPTAYTLTNHIQAYYGSAGGKISRYLNQVLPLNSGATMIQTSSIPQNVPIAELFISGLANVTDITQLLLQTNGQIIEPNSPGSVISARDSQRLIGSVPSGQLVLLPTTQFTLNSSSEFQITTSQAESNTGFLWYWLE